MDNDNPMDIIGSGWQGNEVSFWTCSDISANNWQKTMVTDQLPIAVNAIGRDIDLDGDKDIIAVGKVPGELVIYLKEVTGFTKEVLYPDFNGGSALAVFDIDLDGDDDIIAGAGILKQLYLFENKTITTAMPGVTPGSSGLRIVPNPSEGIFLVTIPERSAAEIQVVIFDTNGKQVFSNNRMLPVNNQVRIIAPGLEDGYYILKIFVSDHLFQGKLLISRPSTQSR